MVSAARTKGRRYWEAYATRPGATYAFLPCVMSTPVASTTSSYHSSTSSPTQTLRKSRGHLGL